MQKLISTAEASKILGISVQGIHYRIKKGSLESIKKDGRTFVYLDENTKFTNQNNKNSKHTNKDNDLLKSKDDQIELLKENNLWIKQQYNDEINRLQKNQNKIIKVFKSEISLLKQAFFEMKNIYKISNKNENSVKKNTIEFMKINDFFVLMKNNGKSNEQIKGLILSKIKQKDKRFIFDIKNKVLLIYKDAFSDII